MKRILRRIRGTLGTALVWGAMWFGGTFVLAAGYILFEGGPGEFFAARAVAALLIVSTQGAVVGFVTGGAFSAYIAFTFRDQAIEDLSQARFAVWGSLVAVSLTLVAGTLLGLAEVGKLPFLSDLTWAVLFAATFGGLTGYGTAKLAQNALGPGDSPDELESGSEQLLSQP